MRCLGEIGGRQHAERLVAHLLTKEISTHIESAGANTDRWEIWVREEDRLQFAVDQLREFKQNPEAPKYEAAIAKAREILREQKSKHVAAAKNIRKIKTVVRPSMVSGRGLPPMTMTLLILCVVLSMVSNFMAPSLNNGWGTTIVDNLGFVDVAAYEKTQNPAVSLMNGQLWRMITPIFLHGDMLHLAMNMFGLVVFGRVLERLMGTPKFAVFVLILAIVPNLLQGLMPPQLHGSPIFVGFSGVVYGFLGYVWVRSTLNPMFGIAVPLPFIILAVGMIVLGLSGTMPDWRYADLCHLGGIATGALIGFVAEKGNAA